MAQSVILLSKDGLEVPVDMSVAELSSVLKAKLASISDPAGKWVLLDNIRGEVLQKIVEWMNQHRVRFKLILSKIFRSYFAMFLSKIDLFLYKLY